MKATTSDQTDADRRWACNRPAVPVVHPEPGEHRTARWLAAYAPGDRLHPAVIARRLMALADVEVAAAVAAVRADTAAMVEAEARKWLGRGVLATGQAEAFLRIANQIAEDRS